jgi:apolipoprotein N-acyltransferase
MTNQRLICAALFSILYALAWIGQSFGLSFTAWLAFVPLFWALDTPLSMGRKMGMAAGAMALAHVLAFSWFLTVSDNRASVWSFSAFECLMAGMPLVLFIGLRSRFFTHFSNKNDWFLLPFLFGFWEWAWHHSGLSVAFFMVGVGNSQIGLPFFIQWLDILGIEAVSTWVVLVNVLIYKSLSFSVKMPPSVNGRKLATNMVLAFIFPVFYGFYQYSKYQNLPKQEAGLNLSLFRLDVKPTGRHFNEILEQDTRNLEKIIHLTDSIADAERQGKIPPNDLMVWYEGAYVQGISKVDTFVQQVVNDAQTPILTGATLLDTFQKRWNINATVVLSPNKPMSPPSVKQFFVPHWEDHLQQHLGTRLHTIKNQTGTSFNIAAPICFEQNVPDFWSNAVRKGAEAFVMVAFEAWFGNTVGREPQVSNITALRCIETKRWCARTSNGGATAIFNPLGQRVATTEGTVLHGKIFKNDSLTVLVQFPYLGIGVLLMGFLVVLSSPFWQTTEIL